MHLASIALFSSFFFLLLCCVAGDNLVGDANGGAVAHKVGGGGGGAGAAEHLARHGLGLAELDVAGNGRRHRALARLHAAGEEEGDDDGDEDDEDDDEARRNKKMMMSRETNKNKRKRTKKKTTMKKTMAAVTGRDVSGCGCWQQAADTQAYTQAHSQSHMHMYNLPQRSVLSEWRRTTLGCSVAQTRGSGRRAAGGRGARQRHADGRDERVPGQAGQRGQELEEALVRARLARPPGVLQGARRRQAGR